MPKYNSYAQFCEDVVLMRAIGHVSHEVGFYIDVGANDPERESVTKVFYDHSWHGINIDASARWVERLREDRPRDINIFAAVSDKAGEITFYDQPDGGLGTTVASIAEMHREGGQHTPLTATTVPAVTLTSICEEHVRGEIHFLKIDVEGGEGPVLRGLDLKRYRPWIMCIECHLPDHPEVQLYGEWEPYLIEAGYRYAYGDVFNRFYVSSEHSEIADKLVTPIDDYRRFADVREINDLKGERDLLNREIERLREELGASARQLDEANARLAAADDAAGRKRFKLW